MSVRQSSTTNSILQRHLPKLLIALASAGLLAGGAYFVTRKSPSDHLAQARELQRQGNFKAAAIELKSALQQNPNNVDARFLLAQALYSSNDFSAAEKELRKVKELGGQDDSATLLLAHTLILERLPDRVLDEINVSDRMPADKQAEVHALRAIALFMKGNREEARKELIESDKKEPNHIEALHARAQFALAEGDKTAALGYVNSALAKNAARADLWVLKGDLLHGLGQNKDAEIAYSEALKNEPGNVAAHVARIQIYLDTSDLDKAAAQLSTLHKYAPNYLLGDYLDAMLEFRRGNYTGSYDKLQVVYQNAPDFLPAHMLGGAVCLTLKKRQEAQSHLNRILEVQPDHLAARKLMAATMLELGQVDQARVAIQSLQGTGDDAVLTSLRGSTALREKNYSLAHRELSKAATSLNATPGLYMELAASERGLGDTEAMFKSMVKAAELDKASTRSDLILIDEYLRAKRYDDAFKAVGSLENKKLSPALIENVRGMIYIAKQDIPQARASFNKALQADPTLMAVVSNLASLDIMAKDYNAAKSHYERALKHSPNDSRAWLGLAKIAAVQKDDKGYLSYLEKAKVAVSKDVEPRLLLTRYWLAKNNPSLAIAEAREALAATRENSFYELIGLAQLMQGDVPSAQASFARWANENPGSPKAWTRLASAQAKAGQLAEAFKSLEKAFAAQPGYLDATAMKMSLLVQDKRIKEAMIIAHDLQAKYPKAALGYIGEAEALSAEGKHFEAGKGFAKAAQMANHGQLLLRAYDAYSAAGKAADGTKLLEQWLQSRPDDGLIRRALAAALEKSGRKQDAIAQYRLLLKANPSDLLASNNMAILLSDLKDPGAVAAAEQTYKLGPNNPAVIDTLGYVLIHNGQAKRGMALIKQAFDKQPDSKEFQFHYAQALVAIGEPVLARQELDRMLSRGKDFPQAAEARKLMDSLKR